MHGRNFGTLLLTAVCFFPKMLQGQERILFVSDRDGNREVYAMLADGSQQVNLSRNSARDQAPAVSPDGQTVAFMSDRSGQLGVWLMDLQDHNARLFVELPEADFGLEWSPDGRMLALSLQGTSDRTHDIGTLDVVTGQVERLTDTQGVEELTPAWSPDGSLLYYVTDDGSGSSLVALNLATGTPHTVISAGIGTAAFPKISPDGRRALLRSRVANQFDVLLIDLAKATVENITAHSSNDWGASWSADGGTIVFASDRDGDMELYTINLANRTLQQLTYNEVRDWMPVWVPR